MKRLAIAIAGSLFAATALAACAHGGYGYGQDGPRYSRDYDDGRGMRRDMPMHRGMMGSGMVGPAMMDGCPYEDYGYGGSSMWGSPTTMGPAMGRLGLDEEQGKRVAEIRGELNRQLTALDQQFVSEQSRLREIHAQPSFDRAKAAEVGQHIVDLRRQRAETMRTAHERIDMLLTPDQRAQWRRGWRW